MNIYFNDNPMVKLECIIDVQINLHNFNMNKIFG